MISFADLTKQVNIINDTILADMTYGSDSATNEDLSFTKHLQATKLWFSRISNANKKVYVLALLEGMSSAWALSWLLKSIWNCRPKDAVISANEYRAWSSYDQVPMDHNRTAQPVSTLAQVMRVDRLWFRTLEPQAQAMVLLELLAISGGPVMWEVLRRAQTLYERYRHYQLQNLQECVVVNDPPADKSQATDKSKSTPPSAHQKGPLGEASTADEIRQRPPGHAQAQLEANLAGWNAAIKSMRDSLKLEELEMIFTNGTKRKIWKVNRVKPEALETVDFIQLLPSAIAKNILSYLPRAQLADYSRVNKYWAYLVDDFKAELAAQLKIDTDFNKLEELMLKYDASMQFMTSIDNQVPVSSLAVASVGPSIRMRIQPSMRPSEKSGAVMSYRFMMPGNLSKPIQAQRPITNVAEFMERLDKRGAADENIWKWCDNVLTDASCCKKKRLLGEGILNLANAHFPCPMMKESLKIPLKPPLLKDPARDSIANAKRNISNATVLDIPKLPGIKRYSLWSKDFSSLYPVMKIPSYQAPV